MTLAEALAGAASRLQEAGIEDARLEAEVLLMHALGTSRERLFAQLQEPLDAARQETYEALIARRLAHEPTAYITGRREFFGLDLGCSSAALIPRPETELLVETALGWIADRGPSVTRLRAVDVGTGNGAIAVALAKNAPHLHLVATDISQDALALASANAAEHDVAGGIDFVRGSLLGALRGLFDLVVSNLPYIPTRTYNTLPPEIREHEPEEALRAGRRGTALVEELLEQAQGRLSPGGLLLAEHGWNQGRRLREAAADHFPTAEIETQRDLAGLERLLVVRVD